MRNLIIISASLLLLSASFLFGWSRGKKSVKPTTLLKEVIIRDTERIAEPVVVPELVIIEDTIFLEVLIRDTLCSVPLVKETKTYKGSNYMAKVSGYNPSLDYIEIYKKNSIKYINTSEPQKKWDISAVMGVNFTGYVNPYIAGQIAYNLRKLTIAAQFGRDINAKTNFVTLEVSSPIIRW